MTRYLPVRAASCVACLAACLAQARVVRIEVEHRGPAYAGKAFGGAGHYEILRGRTYGELDPADSHNAVINDLALAPRNARGRVEYSATFTLILPVDRAKISGVLLYETPNRGRSPLSILQFTDDLNAGHILLSSGWQGDIEPRSELERISVPAARNVDGTSITGPVLARLADLPAGATTASLTAGFAGLRYHRPATLDSQHALLTRQSSDDGAVMPIASDQWAFADCTKTPFPGAPDATKICVKTPFEQNYLYQVVYQAKDPLVLGIGPAAVRDVVSFLRYADHDDSGNPNPLASRIRHAIAFGTSQSGNFLKTFLNLGFNQDEGKRLVWDGVNPNIAARQTPLNFRFAIPGGAAGLYEPGSEGVLWWSDYRDNARHLPTGGLLDRCRTTHTCPKIIETFGSAEFWGLRMSPGLVGTGAGVDIPLPPEVRRYYFPGVTHGGGKGGFDLTPSPMPGGSCVLAANSNSTEEAMRALRKALIDWVVRNTPPPDSRYPRLDRGELVPPDAKSMGFPRIPGAPLPDNMVNPFWIYDFGPSFRNSDLSGAISIQPPIIRGTIPMLVPRTDTDGNEVGGIPSALLQVRLGTYLGWNVTASGYRRGRSCGFAGGFIPFAHTRAERISSGDPRPSIEERYGTHEKYVESVRAAARRLVRERFMLEDDAVRLIGEAATSNILR